MEHETQTAPPVPTPKPVSLKIFGVGNAGIHIVDRIAAAALPGVALAALNTDPDCLRASTVSEKICIEPALTRGLGTGGDPERGRAAAEQCLSILKSACAGADIVFIVTGLGGGAGTGASPVLAHVARESGAVVLVFAALPFACEGNRRQRVAREGLRELQAIADAVFCMPNQELFKLIDENTSVVETFQRSDAIIAEGVFSVWRLVACKGLIELHFADLCSFLRETRGECRFAGVESSGPIRSREVIENLVAHPMLEGGRILEAAEAVLVSIVGGPDLTMVEVNRVMEHINFGCARAQVMMGAAVDPKMQGRLAVNLVVTARPQGSDSAVHPAGALGEVPAMQPASVLQPAESHRDSRVVPAPSRIASLRSDSVKKPGATVRQRASGPRLRQGQLPLEIISRGRFDKSEPTIHKGEDLDVPTYIRRGVALN